MKRAQAAAFYSTTQHPRTFSSHSNTHYHIHYFNWEFNDGIINDSDGSVTRYTMDHISGPRLGDQRFYKNGDILSIF